MTIGNPTDALAIAAEKIKANGRLVTLASALSAGGLDVNGATDLRIKQQELNDRVNMSSTISGVAYSGFGIGGIST